MSQHQLAEDKQKAKLPETVSVNEIDCQGAMKVQFLQSAVRASIIIYIPDHIPNTSNCAYGPATQTNKYPCNQSCSAYIWAI